MESDSVLVFKQWLSAAGNGMGFHLATRYQSSAGGSVLVAAEDIPGGSTIVSIPFSLAITKDVARNALSSLANDAGSLKDAEHSLQQLSERQLICIYICLHWIDHIRSPALAHGPYLATLPHPSQLLTPLHFALAELAAFKGSNIYGATLDRERQWKAEWMHAHSFVHLLNDSWSEHFTWTRYLTAATYLSSRAFPSTILSPEPSLKPTPTSYPVLLPGIDALNHARAQPVSWVVSRLDDGSLQPHLQAGLDLPSSSEPHIADDTSNRSNLAISLVLHGSVATGCELLNNYGPKPNSELVLGYGFSLPYNPDDTIVLRIGGSGFRPSQPSTPVRSEFGTDSQAGLPLFPTGSLEDVTLRQGTGVTSNGWSGSEPCGRQNGAFELGRDARGADAVWNQVLAVVRGSRSPDDEASNAIDGEPCGVQELEDELDAAELLQEMTVSLLERLPASLGHLTPSVVTGSGQIRTEVRKMHGDYVEGQRDILTALLRFAEGKERGATARTCLGRPSTFRSSSCFCLDFATSAGICYCS